MKKKLFYLTILLAFLFCFFMVLIFPKNTILIAENALTVFKEKLFPSLFPFLVLGEILILLGIPNYLSVLLDKPFRFLFKMSGTSSFLILISLFSGFPSGPKFTKKIYLKGEISKDEANHLLQIVHFSNPLFVLGTVHFIVKNKPVTYLILFSHILSNFLLLFLTRTQQKLSFSKNPKTFQSTFNTYAQNITQFGIDLLDAIKSSIDTLLFMLGSVTFFMILSSFLKQGIPTLFLKTFFTGVLDLTTGILALDQFSSHLFIQGILATFFLSFGSLSVHIQVFNALKETDLSFSSFFKGRIYASILSIVLFSLLYTFLIINGGCY